MNEKKALDRVEREHAIRVFRNGGHCGDVACLRCLYDTLAKAA